MSKTDAFYDWQDNAPQVLFQGLLMGLSVTDRAGRVYRLDDYNDLCVKVTSTNMSTGETKDVWLIAPSEIADLIALAYDITREELDKLWANIGLNLIHRK